jgi:predicted GIY-YIG superfamily endonuclease
MVNLFGNTFNKKVVTHLAGESLKYTRAQYRQRLEENLKYECPPMVWEKEWKALIEDAKENFLKRQGKEPRPGKARYDTYHIFSEICSIFFFFFCFK